MSGRDPRLDPRAGDVLRKDGCTREVYKIDRESETDFVWFDDSTDPPGAGYGCRTMTIWRRWAAGAEVLREEE